MLAVLVRKAGRGVPTEQLKAIARAAHIDSRQLFIFHITDMKAALRK